MENRSFYIDLVKKIGFSKGDTVLLAADFVNMLIFGILIGRIIEKYRRFKKNFKRKK